MKYLSRTLHVFLFVIISSFLIGCGNGASEDVQTDVEEPDIVTEEETQESEQVEEEEAEATDANGSESNEFQSETLDEFLEELAITNAELGAEYSVQFKGKELEFNYLNCNPLPVSNFLAAEGKDYNFYVQYHFDENGIDYDRLGVSMFDRLDNMEYVGNPEQFNQVTISEDGRIVKGVMDLKLLEEDEVTEKTEEVVFYLNCGDIGKED